MKYTVLVLLFAFILGMAVVEMYPEAVSEAVQSMRDTVRQEPVTPEAQ